MKLGLPFNRDFTKVYKENKPKIFNFIHKRINSKEDAEDITEEVFLKVYKNLADFKWQGVSIEAWIYKIARNSIIDFVRKKQKEKGNVILDEVENVIPNNDKDILLSLLDMEEEQVLYNSISGLTPEDQYLIYYRYFEELPIEEIANRLDLSETNIGTRLHRLRKKLLINLKTENAHPQS